MNENEFFGYVTFDVSGQFLCSPETSFGDEFALEFLRQLDRVLPYC